MDSYELVKKLGSGNFGVINLMRHRESGELVAVKQLPRGPKIDKNVYREVINHRKLSHPNVIGFHSVHVDTRYLYIIMEYGTGVCKLSWQTLRADHARARAHSCPAHQYGSMESFAAPVLMCECDGPAAVASNVVDEQASRQHMQATTSAPQRSNTCLVQQLRLCISFLATESSSEAVWSCAQAGSCSA